MGQAANLGLWALGLETERFVQSEGVGARKEQGQVAPEEGQGELVALRREKPLGQGASRAAEMRELENPAVSW